MPIFHFQIKVPNEYLSFFKILYNSILLLILFHLMYHFITNRALLIHAFQGGFMNHSFGILLGIIFLLCFSYFIVNEQIIYVEFIPENENIVSLNQTNSFQLDD